MECCLFDWIGTRLEQFPDHNGVSFGDFRLLFETSCHISVGPGGRAFGRLSRQRRLFVQQRDARPQGAFQLFIF
jgi:hypothetical protein